MTAYEYIKEISEASKNSNLTFFIGAGISKLSHYPDWKELTNEFSKKLGLEIKDENSNYTNEEYLAIPQKYYYSINENKYEYYKLIKQHLDKEIEPNIIHDLILTLKPASIITTNFDNLIEKSVSKNGKFYDVIASDLTVSNAMSSKFILKVHGDLENENIVLKEEDYLNYSNNFRLIETLLKSIFSTNTVVFIGYTLGDYNIKLILNWVRVLQGDGFKTPYFIYTDNSKLSELDMMYYKSRGLKIIDYKELSEEKAEWLLRYKVVLESIIDFDENDFRKKDSESIEYLYTLLKPLNELNALRRKDVGEKLKGDYILDDEGIIRKYNLHVDYLEKFNEIYIEMSKSNNIEIASNIKSKYEIIKSVFEKAHIFGYINGNRILKYKFDYKFGNNFIDMDYQKIDEYSKIEYSNYLDNYVRAYFLFKMGKFKDAYDKYVEVAQECFNKKDYLMYYLSQVNRYTAYRAMLSSNSYVNSPIGILTGNGNTQEYLSEETQFIMKRFDIDEIFESLPLEFKNAYSTLKDLYNQKGLYSNIYNIMNAIGSVEKHIKNKSTEFGFTSIGKVIGIFNPNLNFVYGNYLIVDEYDEFKDLVKETMKAVLLTYSSEKFEYLFKDEMHEIGHRSKEIKLDMMNFSCLIQYFKTNEIKDIFREYGIKQLDFIKWDMCFKIVENIFKYYKINGNEFDNRFLQDKISRYLNNLIQILKYVRISKEQYSYVVNEMFSINNNILNITDKILFLDKQQANNCNIHGQVYQDLELVLINYLNEKIECLKQGSRFSEYSYNSLSHINIVNYIVANNELFKSEKVDCIVKYILEEKIKFNIDDLIKLNPILYEDTIGKIVSLAKENLEEKFSLNTLMYLINYKLIEITTEYEKQLVDYINENIEALKRLENELKQEKDICKSFNKIAEEQSLRKNIMNSLDVIGYWCFDGIMSNHEFLKFKNISKKFDFFIDIKSFDFDDFDDMWLIDFDKIVHEKIANYKNAKTHIRNRIENYLRNISFDAKQKEEMLNIYLEVYDRD